eukprot:3698494-Pyramimonas_sp.AAC.1
MESAAYPKWWLEKRRKIYRGSRRWGLSDIFSSLEEISAGSRLCLGAPWGLQRPWASSAASAGRPATISASAREFTVGSRRVAWRRPRRQ